MTNKAFKNKFIELAGLDVILNTPDYEHFNMEFERWQALRRWVKNNEEDSDLQWEFMFDMTSKAFYEIRSEWLGDE